jgi:hypothetical protein
VRINQAAWTAYTQVSWLGRRARNITRESTTEGWQDHRQIDWLVTSQRVVGRRPASGELFSLWWSGVTGVEVDIKRDCIVLNTVNGWTGMLTGPTVAPLAVAAIAMCHGPEALLVHPALAPLRQGDPSQPTPPQQPEVVASGAMIVRLPTRRPTA